MRLTILRGTPETLERLHPAYFAIVMATGIVAIALELQGVKVLPGLMLLLNVLLFLVVSLMFVRRFWHFRSAFVADLSSHARGVGFFTWVAAPGVLGTQLILQVDTPYAALAFWALATLAWVLTSYGVFAAIMLRTDKPSMGKGINGGWLVGTVATQSVAILTLLLAQAGVWGPFTEQAVFAAFAMWLGGGMQYILVLCLIFLRYSFHPIEPEDLTPPYWINMGAVAISTLAGVTLVKANQLSPVVFELSGFIKGLTLLYWAVGTGWIPMLLVLGIWRYVLRGLPLQYDALYWGAVFPLGMYSVCTARLPEILSLPFLAPVSTIFALLAAFAWLAAFAGMVDSIMRGVRNHTADTSPGAHDSRSQR